MEILLESNNVQQRAPRLDIDQEIDVAVSTIVAPSHRAEHPYIARTVACCKVQDFAAEAADAFERHASMIVAWSRFTNELASAAVDAADRRETETEGSRAESAGRRSAVEA